jgi:uncharacterized membrane protein YeaQ/YmgE (transglycosylase-associated protein family)
MLGLIVWLALIGLIAGAIARLLVPGRQNMGILTTIIVGIVGSFVGGFLGYVLFHNNAQNGRCGSAVRDRRLRDRRRDRPSDGDRCWRTPQRCAIAVRTGTSWEMGKS